MVKVMRSIVTGPLEPYAAGFAEDLLRQGYTWTSAEQQVCFITHLDRWMSGEGVGLDGLSRAVLERYLVERRAAGYVEYRSWKALRPLLDHLAALGVLVVLEEVAPGTVEVVLRRYSSYLVGERALTAGTARGYVDCVRPFVAARVRGEVVDLATISAGEVTGFVLAACPGRAVGSAKLIVCALRSFLRWLQLTGQTPTSLADAVPAVAGWKLSNLPKALEPDQLHSLLTACDLGTPTGRRDYAVLLLLSRLGLRAGEVARLSLLDIDWRRGEITVVGKGNRSERLPLPADVGAAITAYLRRGRPETAEGRWVFVRVRAPHRGLTPGGVSEVVFDAAQRAGLGKVHAHRLRHTAATAMLRASSPLPEIGQVLRHRSALSTAIYAKVDRDALAVLARPWPRASEGSRS
jgi:integrase/recombinase XerD